MMTFAEFQQAMIIAAKRLQAENYVGDDYYLQLGCWEEHWKDGDTPEEAVLSDMSYWEP
jgi:hypothetical protein